MDTAFIALGSNVGDRAANLIAARAAIDALPSVAVRASSRVYETDPVGPIEQGDYLNAVVRASCSIVADDLMRALLGIERDMGRVRTEKWGPRVIDLDLVLFGDEAIDSPALTVPHPRFAERRFVLRPMCDIEPARVPPGGSRSVSELLNVAPAMRVDPVDVPGW